MFTPADDPKNNVWYLRDSAAIAAAKKWDTAAPFYIEQEAPVPPGGWPKPGKLVVACRTTTCNMPSPGSASRSDWPASMWCGLSGECARGPKLSALRTNSRRAGRSR